MCSLIQLHAAKIRKSEQLSGVHHVTRVNSSGMVWANALAGRLGLGWSNLVFNDSTGQTIFLATWNEVGLRRPESFAALAFAVIRALAFVLALATQVLAFAFALRSSRPRRKRLRPANSRTW